MIIWWDQICGASFLSWLFPFKFFLIIISYFYRGVFFTKKFFFTKSAQKALCLPVISVGNISVGGTGKSVVTQFIVRHFSRSCAGILLRGYGRDRQGADPLVISQGKGLCVASHVAGDEASMYAAALNVPIVVGRSRAEAAELLPQHQKSYFLLDDGYQHSSLHKDFELVLLDARHPFENGWCLPAGRLREHDLSRAHAIILTHAEYLSVPQLTKIQMDVALHVSKETPLFCGKHVVSGVRFWDALRNDWESKNISKYQVAAIAAIGSFDQFVESIRSIGGDVCATFSFPDHHRYDIHNLSNSIMLAMQKGCTALVTTTKDWPKILPLIHLLEKGNSIAWAVLDIDFAFLTTEEQVRFFEILERICQGVEQQNNIKIQ